MSSPVIREVRLTDPNNPSPPIVAATLIRHCPADWLVRLEESWATARLAVAETTAVTDEQEIEHGHWDWTAKRESVLSGIHQIVMIECRDEIQGVMAIQRQHRDSQLTHGCLLYVDYLEVAPWNLRVAGRSQRFTGVGRALLIDAIMQSDECGLAGAIGLHSLPQAQRFYEKCGMTSLGPDHEYFGLPYYELSGPQAMAWLSAQGET